MSRLNRKMDGRLLADKLNRKPSYASIRDRFNRNDAKADTKHVGCTWGTANCPDDSCVEHHPTAGV